MSVRPIQGLVTPRPTREISMFARRRTSGQSKGAFSSATADAVPAVTDAEMCSRIQRTAEVSLRKLKRFFAAAANAPWTASQAAAVPNASACAWRSSEVRVWL